MIKYIVFDRDGTLIKHIPYLHNPSEVELLPFVKQTIIKLIEKDYKLFLHTNQSGIARGMFKHSDAEKCNDKLISLLGSNVFENICISKDLNHSNRNYRKPSPKFGLEILDKYKINPNLLTYIGDSLSDMNTAKNIDCNFIGLNTGLIKFKNKFYKGKNFNYHILDNFSNILKII